MKRFIYISSLIVAILLPLSLIAQISSSSIVINPVNIAPDSLVSNAVGDTACAGDEITLSISGGTIGDGARWIWYADDCGTGIAIDSGASITVQPNVTTHYFCTAEGGCNIIVCREITINIKPADQCTPLPLHLLNFTAYLYEGNKGLLKWETANEINTASFDVEQSSDGISFEKLGNVTAAGSGDNTYQLIDGSLKEGKNYYRLKIIDNDNSYTYSPVRIINYNTKPNDVKLYPNPANDRLNFEFDIPTGMMVKVVILNAVSQKMIAEQTIKATPGNNMVSFDVNQIADGSYLFYYQIGNTEPQVIKFVKEAK